tara:strand:+ start:672 stop:1853 length:1182 start_codon:yes stop_codon:yes gene_type:complete
VKILLISNKPIYPKTDGGCVAMDNFLKSLLSSNFEVNHIAIGTEKHPFEKENYPLKLRNKISVSGQNISTNVNIFSALKSLFKKGSYNINRFYSTDVSEKIKLEVKDNEFDVIIFESLFSTIYLNEIKEIFTGKIIARIHNIEADIWKNYWKNEVSFLRKLFLRKLQNDLKKYEIETLKKVDGIIAISNDDKKSILELKIKTTVITVPVAITDLQNQNNYMNTSVFHLGAMDWQPNKEAVERLVTIHTEANVKQNSFKLIIAGKNAETFKTSSSSDLIENIGFIEDLDTFTKDAGILVSPIISGSGVRIKILEMMAKGIPVITSETGAKGINYKDYECLMIASDNNDFIEKIKLVRESLELRKKLGQNAIDYIQKYHNIEEITKSLREFIQNK